MLLRGPRRLFSLISYRLRHRITFVGGKCALPSALLVEYFAKSLEVIPNGRSRSLKMAPFDRSYTTFYSSAIVSIALCCTIFELFDLE